MHFRLTKDVAHLRSIALKRLDDAFDETVYARTTSPVAIVRAKKLAEALRWKADGNTGPFLESEARVSGRPVATVVEGITAKAAVDALPLVEIETRRQRAQAAIRTAPHPAAIEAALEEFLNG